MRLQFHQIHTHLFVQYQMLHHRRVHVISAFYHHIDRYYLWPALKYFAPSPTVVFQKDTSLIRPPWKRKNNSSHTGPNFIELLSTKICLAWNLFLDKSRITNKVSICCIFLVTGIQLLFAYPENHLEIWWVILLLSRKKFHAKQFCVLSSSMKLGPGDGVLQNP